MGVSDSYQILGDLNFSIYVKVTFFVVYPDSGRCFKESFRFQVFGGSRHSLGRVLGDPIVNVGE